MNKKGFTLVELLAVIAIIALISLISIPNIVGLSEGVKKDQMLDDAKRMISVAKYQVNKNYGIRNSEEYIFEFNELNASGDFNQDPDGLAYENGGVVYKNTETSEGKVIEYCVFLISKNRQIGTSATDCVSEDNLHSRGNVVDR